MPPLVVVVLAVAVAFVLGGPLALFVPLLLLLPGRDDSLPFLAGLAYRAGVLVAGERRSRGATRSTRPRRSSPWRRSPPW